MIGWSSVPLGSLCEVFSGFPFTSAQFTNAEHDVALVKGENVGQGEILWDIAKRWPRDKTENLVKYRLAPDDVVVAMDRPWVPSGLKFARIGRSDPEAYLVQRVARLRARPGLNQRFLYYVVGSLEFVEYIKNAGRGATVPHISGKQISEYRFLLPPDRVQVRIAEKLSAYDDLIENNRRRMQLLEDAARQLYQEWFVRLRFPGREHTRIADGVPERWARRQLIECASFQSGGTPSKARAEFWEGDIPWVSSGELTSMRIHRTKLNVTAEAVDAGSRMVPPETILAVVRGMSLAKEFRIGMTAGAMSFNQDLKAIVAKPEIDALLLFHALDAQRERIREQATEASHGTKKLDTAVLSEVPIMVPSRLQQRLFRENVEPMHAQWDNLDQQNQKLRTARDLLLPRLMSGELRV